MNTFCMAAMNAGADYLHAQRLRSYLHGEYKKLMERVDFIANPSQPSTAPLAPVGAPTPREWWMNPNFAAPANVVGTPSLSVPCGFDSAGMPIGLMLTGRPFGEGTMLRVAHVYQQSARWHERRPAL